MAIDWLVRWYVKGGLGDAKEEEWHPFSFEFVGPNDFTGALQIAKQIAFEDTEASENCTAEIDHLENKGFIYTIVPDTKRKAA